MGMDRVRVGLIGAGGISRAHIPGFLAYREHATVTAIADTRLDAAREARHTLGGGDLYIDWRELLDRADVDAVDICLPHDLHEQVAVAAAERGKHILVEKPIARTLAEADAMLTAAERAGVTLMVCHDRRYHPAFARIKELLDAGVIGRPLCLRLDHNQNIQLTPDHWIFQKERLGGGAIMSCLTHQFDLMRWYGGEVAQVGCLSLTEPERMDGEIIGVVPLRFASGAIGDALINWHVQATLPTLPNGLWYEMVWLSGTEGNLHNLQGIHLFQHKRAADGYVSFAVPEGTGHVGAIAHFIDCVREGRTPLTNGHEGRAALEIAMAAYASEASGCFIDLPMAQDVVRA